MKWFRSVFILFFLAISLVACVDQGNNSAINGNEAVTDSKEDNVTEKVPAEKGSDELENSEIVIERSLEEEFSDLAEIIGAIERYFSFINSRSQDDPEGLDVAVLDVIHSTADDEYLPTMTDHFRYIQIESYAMASMKKLNDNIYLIRGIIIERHESANGEVSYEQLDANPYVCRLDGAFKLALAKDQIPETLYDNLDDIEENYDPIMRWFSH